METLDSVPIKLPLDRSVERQQGESLLHWAGKAAVANWLQTHPELSGSVQSEKKVEDLIADLRCEFTTTPPSIPRKCVIEIQTRNANKNIVKKTERYHRYGYSVYWVYHKDAPRLRRDAEEALDDHMEKPPSLGLISLEDGELHLGQPIEPDEFERPQVAASINELYIPTHHRPNKAFDHGDFTTEDDGDHLTLLTIDGRIYSSQQIDSNGQRTLPTPVTGYSSRYALFASKSLERTCPVRGPP